METLGQTMGLTETLNGLDATSASNGIDVHMMLPTEYGAVAILSASGYGNPKKLRDETNAQKRTTTGNATGVYFTGDKWEVTASWTTRKYSVRGRDGIGSIALFGGDSGWHDGKFSQNSSLSGQQVVPGDKMDGYNYTAVMGLFGLFSCGMLNTNGWEKTRYPAPTRGASVCMIGV